MTERKRQRQEEAAARQAARDERTTVQQLRRLAERDAIGGKEWTRLLATCETDGEIAAVAQIVNEHLGQ
jgi:hypothetical protein